MQPSITFTVVAAPNKKLVRKTWAVVLCQIGNRKVHIEASRWPAPPLSLLLGSVFNSVLTQKDYHGKKRYFVSDPKPADPAFFDLSHQLASDFPELRARLGKLVKRNAGKSLLDAATDPVKLKTLLKVPTKRAEKIILSLGGFTLAGVDAAAALNDESIIPVNMCSELKLSDKIEVASNPYHLCVALQSSECHSKLKVLCIADALAKSRGLSPDDPNRLEAHAEFAINRVCQQTGSYWVPPTSVVTEAGKHMQKNWPSDVSTEPAVRTALQGTARIVCEQDGFVSTKKMAETEHRVAVWVTRLASRGPPAPKALALAQHILDCGNTSSPCAEALLHLDQTQQAAVISALSNPVSIITGRAGTGKSSVLAVIEMLVDVTASPISDGSVIDTEAKALQRVHEHAAAHHLTLAAPTGKAANRLTQLTGKRASTIHSSLYQQVSPTRIALDETSMLDPLLFRELMDEKGEQLRMLLIVGDDAQLPSVCPGAFLRDLVASGRFPCTALTTIHRTGPGSVIAERASAIARGEDGGIAPAVDGEDAAWTVSVGSVDLSKMRALQRARALHHAKEPFIVLAQTNHTVELLNSELQSFMNPPSPNKREVLASLNNDKGRRVWRENDIVVATKNHYGSSGQRICTNGEKGELTSIVGQQITVKFIDGGHTHTFTPGTPDLLHAYALTAHRSQGSEEEHAIAVVDMYEQFQSRESLYTIASRGKASTAIFGEARKLYAALHRTSRDQRQTMLAQRLMCAK